MVAKGYKRNGIMVRSMAVIIKHPSVIIKKL